MSLRRKRTRTFNGKWETDFFIVEIAKQSLCSEVIKTLKKDNAFEVVMNQMLLLD